MKAIVYTRVADGGVSVCIPSPHVFQFMCGGGGYWNDRPRGFLAELVRRKTCPVLQKGRHITEQAAHRFVNAMQWGGLSTAEAWETIRLHDCTRYGEAEWFQIQDTGDLPDRRFRDAWTRKGSNSGQVRVDLEAARKIQLARIESQVMAANNRALSLQRGKVIKPKWGEIERAIARAASVEELARVRAC